MQQRSRKSVGNNVARYSVRGSTRFRKWATISAAASGVISVLHSSVPMANAGTYFWDTTATGTWQNAANWTTDSTGSTVVGSAVPGVNDTVTFNGSSINGNEIVQLSGGVSITGISFSNTGTTTLQSTSTTTQTITLGSGGINVLAGSGAVTFGGTNGIGITLAGTATAQTWTNNSTGLVTFANGISLGSNPLSLTGSGSFALNGVVTGSVANGTTALTIGTGTFVTLAGANTFTGDVLVNGGTLTANMVNAATSPLGGQIGTVYRTVTLQSGGTFVSTAASFNDNGPSTTNVGLVFNIGTGGGTFQVDGSNVLILDDGTTGITGTGATAQQLQGNGTLTKTGTGVLTLRQQFNFGGAIDITAGTLKPTGATGVLGTTANGTTIRSGAAFDLNGQTITDTDTLTIYGDGLASAPKGVITNSSATAAGYAGPIVLAANSTIGSQAAGTITLSGGVTGAFNLVVSNSSTGGTTFSTVAVNNAGTITNNGTGAGTTTIGLLGGNVTALIQSGASALTLTPAYSATQLGQTITNTGSGLYTLTGGVTGGTNLGFKANGTGGITVTGAMTTSGTITSDGTGAGNVTLTAAIPATVTDILQNSPGTLTLTSGVNAYTGTTTVTQGTLAFAGNPATGATSAFGSATSNIVLGSATTKGTLAYTGATAVTMTRALTINAGGGQIDSTAGVLTLNPGGVLTASTLTIAPGGPLAFGGANGVTLGGATATVPLISGTNSLTKTGAGTLTLSTVGGTAAIQSAMPIFLNQGTLQVTTSNAATTTAMLGSGLLTITPGATLNTSTGVSTQSTLTNNIEIVNSAGIATISTATGGYAYSGTVTFLAGANSPTLRIGNSNGTASTVSFSNTFSGPGNIQFSPSAGGSPINLSGALNITGTISNVGSSTSTAQITSTATFGAGVSAITQAGSNPFTVAAAVPLSTGLNSFASSSTGLFTFSGGFTGTQGLTLNANSTGGIAVTTAALNHNGSVTNAGTGFGTTTISSVIGANVTGVVQNSATSTLVVSGTSPAFAGAYTISNGSLQFASPSAITGFPNPSAGKISVGSGGILNLAYGGAGQFTSANVDSLLTSLVASGAVTYAPTGAGLGLDTTAGSTSYTSSIANPAGTTSFGLVKTGTNTLTLGTTNTFSGPVAVQNGTLSFASFNSVVGGATSSSLGAPSSAANGTISLGFSTNTGALLYTGPGETTDRVLNLAGTTGGALIDSSGANLTFSSAITITGAGAKALTLQGNGSYTFGGNLGSTTANISTGTAPLTLTKTGTGTVRLNGATNALTQLNLAGTLDIGSSSLLVSNTGGTGITATGDATINGTGTSTLTFSSVSTTDGLNNGAASGFTLTINARITGAIPYENFVAANGTGVTVLNGINTYTGNTYINSSVVSVGIIGNQGSTTSNLGSGTTIGINNAGSTLRYTGSGETTDRIINLTGTTAGGIIEQAGTGNLKFTAPFATPGGGAKVLTLQGSTAGTGEIAGAIVDSTGTFNTGVTKAGTGTWTLSGVNTYTGATTVNGGNLILSKGTGTGTLNNTAITINSGGTLSPLPGFVAGNTATTAAGATLTLNPGGTLALNDGTIGNFTLAQGATFAGNGLSLAGGTIGLDIGNSSADQILLTGTLAKAVVSGVNVISLSTAGITSLTAGQTYTLISATNAAGSTLNSGGSFVLANPNFTLGGNSYNFSLSTTTGTLVLTANSGVSSTSIPQAFWAGTTNGSWSYQNPTTLATNFATQSTGAPDTNALPSASTNVVFTANTVGAGGLNTTLDGAFTINSLTFTGAGTANTAGSSIAAGTGSALTLNAGAVNGNAAGNGITVAAGSGAVSISAPVALGATQTWTNNSSNPLSVTGGISGGFGVTVVGAGTVALGSSNGFTGGLNIGTAATNGVASISAGGALGTGAVVLGGTTATGTLIYTGAGETITKTLGLSGTGGGAVLDQSGTGTVKYSSFAASTGAGAHTLTLQGSTTGAGEFAGTLADNGTSVVTTSPAAPAGNSTSLTVASAAGMAVGMTVSGIAIQPNTTITAIAGNVLTLSQVTVNNKPGVAGQTVVASWPTNVTKSGTGAWTLSGDNASNGGNILVTGGTLNLTGNYTGQTYAGFLTLQPTSTSVPSIVNVSGNLNASGIRGANIAGGASVYNQTAGTVVTINGTNSVGNAVVLNVAGAYGMFNLTGGTYRVGIPGATSNASGGRFNTNAGGVGSGFNTAVMYVGGGANPALLDNTFGEWFINGYSLGQITVLPNGTIDHTGSSNPFALFMDTAQTGGAYGVFNVAGGSIITGAQPVQLGNSGTNGSGNSGFINLAAGTLSTGSNMGVSLNGTGANSLYVNYAGGTLKSSAALSQWTPTSGASITTTHTVFGPIDNSNVAGAPSFNGGAVFDTTGGTITLPAAMTLLGASNNGIKPQNLIATGGAGYVGAPAVQFSKPALAGGVPAAGYALISNGAVTGIVITDPGVYGAGETPTITLTGGGATTPATIVSTVLTAANANTGGLTKLGAGTLAITGNANSFGGVVDIRAGVLSVTTLANGGVASSLGQSSNAASNVLLNGGVLGYASTTAAGTTDRNFTFAASGGGFDASGTVAAATFTITASNNIVVAPNLGSATFVLQGSGTATTGLGNLGSLLQNASGTTLGLSKLGAGQWNITNAANTYTGPTVLTAGTLSVGKLDSGGASSSIGASTSAAGNLVLQGGTLQYTGAGASTNRNFTFGNATTAAGGGFDSNGTGPLVITGDMTAVNTGTNVQTLTLTANAASGLNTLGGKIVDSTPTAQTAITKAGAGTWAVTGINTYTGVTTLAAGTLNFNSTGIGTGTVAMNGGTLQWATGNTRDISSNPVTFGATAVFDTNGNDVTLANPVGGVAAFGLTKNGAGTLYLQGANTFGNNNAVTINAGTLKVDSAANLGAATNDIFFSSTGTSTLQFTGSTSFGANQYFRLGAGQQGIIQVDSGTVIIASGAGAATNGVNNNGSSTASALVKTGPGTLQLNGSQGYMDGSGGFVIQQGTLSAAGSSNQVFGDNNPTAVAVHLAGGTLSFDTDTTNIDVAPTFLEAGSTIVNNKATPASAGISQNINALTVQGNYTLNIQAGGNVTSGTATVLAGATTLNGSPTFNIQNNGLGAATQFTVGAVTNGTNSITVTGNGGFQAGAIGPGTGGVTLDANFSGLAVLSAAGTYSGNTAVNGGVLQLNNAAAAGTGAISVVSGSGVLLNATGTYVNAISGAGYIENYNATAGATTLTGNINYSGPTLFRTAGSTVVFSPSVDSTVGPIGAAGAGFGGTSVSGGLVTKAGTAALTLTGANSYTGATAVQAGTLTLASGASLANTAITVSNGATLLAKPGSGSMTFGNTGTLAAGASLNLAANGTLSMVDGAIGTLNLVQESTFATAALTIASANLNLELSATGTDQIILSGGAVNSAITGTNTVNLSFLGTSLTADTYNFLTAPGISIGNTLFKFSNGTNTTSVVLGGQSYTLTLGSSTAGIESLIVSSPVTNLVWTGQQDGNWTPSGGGLNFADATPSYVAYSEGAAVTFQDSNPVSNSNVTSNVVTIDAAGVNPSSVMVNNTAVDYTFKNASGTIGIAGAAGLTKTGTGKLTLLGANTYTGATAINGGVVNVGVADGTGNGPLGNGGVISFGGGTLQYSAANNKDYSARFSTAGNQAISIDTNGQTVTFATALTSAGGSLTKSGLGTLVIPGNSGVNTYTGPTVINGGRLQISGTTGGAPGALSGTPSITVNTGGELLITGATDILGFTANKAVLFINGGAVNNNGTNTRMTMANTVTMVGGTFGGTSAGANGGAYSFNVSGGTPGTAFIATSDASGNPATVNPTGGIALQANNVAQVFNVTRGPANAATDMLVSSAIRDYTGSATTGVLTKTGNGVLTLTGVSNYSGSTAVNGGVVIYAGGSSLTTANGKTLLIGVGGTSGAVVQKSGATVAVAIGTGSAEAASLGESGGYGYYSNSGTFSTGQLALGGQAAGVNTTGVFDQLAGTATVTQSTGYLITGWNTSAGSNGVLNIFGGTVTNNTTRDAQMGFTAGVSSFGMFNVVGSNALFDAAGISGKSVDLAVSGTAANTAGVLNLNAGVLKTNGVKATNTATPTFLNFNGGTLRANAANTTFVSTLTAATIYSGGATIDTNGVNVTIPQVLAAPAGSGLTSIPVATSGVGYIGAPAVRITGGGGTGATAIANVDLLPGSPTYGQLTGFTITSPGNGYTGTPTISLIGGGASTAATAGAAVAAVNSTTGGLTKIGAGTLTLSAANTFAGDINVNAGTLATALSSSTLNPVTGALGNSQAVRNININNGGTLQLGANDTFGNTASTVVSTLVVNAGGTVTNSAVFNTLGPVQLNGGTLNGTGGVSAATQMYSLQGTVSVGGTAASLISGPVAGTPSFGGYHLSANTTFDVADSAAGVASDLNVSGSLVDRVNTGGAGGLTKAGVGTMTITSTSTSSYSGSTNVSAGTLVVNGSVTSTAGVSVATGSTAATLAGTGSIAGPVTVNANGSIRPGDPNGSGTTGVLTVGKLQTASAASAVVGVKLNGTTPGSGYDQVALPNAVASTVTITGSTLNVTLGAQFSNTGSEHFYVIRNDYVGAGGEKNLNPVTGQFGALVVQGLDVPGAPPVTILTSNAQPSSSLPGGYDYYPDPTNNPNFYFSVAYNVDAASDNITVGSGNDVVLAVVPEPGSAALASLALGGLLLRRRRRAAEKV